MRGLSQCIHKRIPLIALNDPEFIPIVIHTKEGYMCLAKACWSREYRLFRVRPKLHMQMHFGLPGCSMAICRQGEINGMPHYFTYLRLRLREAAEQGIECLNPMSSLANLIPKMHNCTTNVCARVLSCDYGFWTS